MKVGSSFFINKLREAIPLCFNISFVHGLSFESCCPIGSSSSTCLRRLLPLLGNLYFCLNKLERFVSSFDKECCLSPLGKFLHPSWSFGAVWTLRIGLFSGCQIFLVFLHSGPKNWQLSGLKLVFVMGSFHLKSCMWEWGNVVQPRMTCRQDWYICT